jgi:hypothetical protein
MRKTVPYPGEDFGPSEVNRYEVCEMKKMIAFQHI